MTKYFKILIEWLQYYCGGVEVEINVYHMYCPNCKTFKKCWYIEDDPWNGTGYYCTNCSSKVKIVDETPPD